MSRKNDKAVKSMIKTNFILTKIYIYIKKTLWPLFMDWVQLPRGYRATSRGQFTFYH